MTVYSGHSTLSTPMPWESRHPQPQQQQVDCLLSKILPTSSLPRQQQSHPQAQRSPAELNYVVSVVNTETVVVSHQMVIPLQNIVTHM